MPRRATSTSPLQLLTYQAPGTYSYDVEVLSVSELRRRVQRSHFEKLHRISFHVILCITTGACTHIVDFEEIKCGVGSIVTIQPSQVHRFDAGANWDGWMAVFRPEFLMSAQRSRTGDDLQHSAGPQRLKAHTHLSPDALRAVSQTLERMSLDAKVGGPFDEVQRLLRHQLYEVLIRLLMAHEAAGEEVSGKDHIRRRFIRFKQLLEKSFGTLRQVGDYAELIGCSERSLNRAVLQHGGKPAKAFITDRIVLEAKRLLAYTETQIRLISIELGFDEPTNFVKYFRREVGCSPSDWRAQSKKNEVTRV